MDAFHAVLLVLVGAGAAFVQRISGFGLGIFAMLFLPHFLPSHTAAASIAALFSCVTTTYNTLRCRKSVAYKTVLPMLLAAFLTIPVAVHFSSTLPTAIFRSILGIVLILLSLYFLFLNKKIQLKPTPVSGILAGVSGGVLSGLFSTGGPPAVLYLTNATADKRTYFATIQFYFCFINLYTTAVRAANGIITGNVLLYAAVGIGGCLLGDFLGKAVFDRLDSDKLKRLIYVGMIISGIVMVL